MRGVCTVLLCLAVLPGAGCGQNPATPSQSITAAAPGTSTVRHEQETPFSGTVTGYLMLNMANPEGCPAAPFTATIDATGTALHMGHVIFNARHCIHMQTGVIGSRALVITAANGDEIHGSYSAQSGYPAPLDQPTHVNGTITFDGGTGRFLNASGTAGLQGWAISKPLGVPRPSQWEFKGTITY